MASSFTETSPELLSIARNQEIPEKVLIQMLTSTNTLVRKASYDYLTNRCIENPELCLLSANHVIRDCKDPNYEIQNASMLALSSMPDIVDKALQVLEENRLIGHPMVKRMIPICYTRIYSHSSEAVISQNIPDLLYNDLRSEDLSVTVNSLLSLQEILEHHGGVKVPKKLAKYLFEKLPECTAYQASVFLYFLNTHYTFSSEKDMFDSFSMVDCCLTSTDPSVIVSCIELFRKAPTASIVADMIHTASNSITTICTHTQPELMNVLLKSLLQLRVHNDFHVDFLVDSLWPLMNRHFFLQKTQLELIPLVTDVLQAPSVVAKLQYTLNNPVCCSETIKCSIALSKKSPEAQDVFVGLMINALTIKQPEILSQVLWALLDILETRKNSAREYSQSNTVFEWLTNEELLDLDSPVVLRCIQKFGYLYTDRKLHKIFSLLLTKWTADDHSYRLLVDTAVTLFVWRPLIGQYFLTETFVKIIHNGDISCKKYLHQMYKALKVFTREELAKYMGVDIVP